jgi:hypothetical protein
MLRVEMDTLGLLLDSFLAFPNGSLRKGSDGQASKPPDSLATPTTRIRGRPGSSVAPPEGPDPHDHIELGRRGLEAKARVLAYHHELN